MKKLIIFLSLILILAQAKAFADETKPYGQKQFQETNKIKSLSKTTEITKETEAREETEIRDGKDKDEDKDDDNDRDELNEETEEDDNQSTLTPTPSQTTPTITPTPTVATTLTPATPTTASPTETPIITQPENETNGQTDRQNLLKDLLEKIKVLILALQKISY